MIASPSSRLGYESWVRARLGWRGLKAEEYVDDGPVMLATPEIKGAGVDFHSAARIPVERYDESPEIALRVGDVLLAKDGSTLGICNVVRELPEPATTNGSIAVITPNDRLDSVFLMYQLQAGPVQAQIGALRAGMGVPHLFQDDIRRLGIIVPPTPIQRSIADFLDRETAKIDALIAKQEELVRHLLELRQSEITGAVTRRNTIPDQEWLPLRRDIAFLTSGSRGWAEYYADEGSRFVRIGNMGRGTLSLDASEIQLVDVPEGGEGSRTALEEGDLLFSITAYLGSVAVVDSDWTNAYVSQHVGLVRLRQRMWSPRYLGYVALSEIGQRQLNLSAYGGTKLQLSLDDLREFRAPCPTHEEQLVIANHLDEFTNAVDHLIQRGRELMALMKERRTALITEAVTGQIDVATYGKGA